MFSHTYTVAIITGLIGSLFSFLLMQWLISAYLPSSDIFNSWQLTYGHLPFYFATGVILGLTTMLDLAITRWKSFAQYSPSGQHD